MHPNTFLRTFWRAEIRSEVFVAMSFDPVYEARFTSVIAPAVQAISYQGKQLQAKRVDLSKTGDSTLSDIIDGVAHSVMVLCDVSTVGHDSKTGVAYRNGNVMYEVGLALASRHPSEVLLIRDDRAPFLFDVSTVPHKHVDFSDSTAARKELATELTARLAEIDHLNDARLAMAVATLTPGERYMLADLAKYGMKEVFWFKKGNLATAVALPRLLDKQLLRAVYATRDGTTTFQWTVLGRILAANIEKILPRLPLGQVEEEQHGDDDPPPSDGDAS